MLKRDKSFAMLCQNWLSQDLNSKPPDTKHSR